MNLSKHFIRVVVFSVCALFLGAAAHGQYRASIQGVVTDPQGATVSGATVTLTNHETNQTLTTTTDDAGIYNFTRLPPSQYTLTIEKMGFKKKVLDNVSVIAEQANALTRSAAIPSNFYSLPLAHLAIQDGEFPGSTGCGEGRAKP